MMTQGWSAREYHGYDGHNDDDGEDDHDDDDLDQDGDGV